MNRKNTMKVKEFIGEHIWWIIVAWIWYKTILFRCLPHYTTKESRLFLFGIIIVCCGIGILFEIRSQRNEMSVLMNLLTGYGCYSVWAYYPIKPVFIRRTITVAVIIALVYSILILCRKIRCKSRFKRILLLRAMRAVQASKEFICLSLAIIMIVIGVNVVFGTSLVTPSISPAERSRIDEWTIANNMSSLVLLQEDKWATLSLEEKLDVLQVVANIEQRYLGLSNELTVGADNLSEGLTGSYSDSEHRIIVSLDSLMNDSAYELTDTIAHEAYHAYQHRMVEAYDEASEEFKTLLLFYDATLYKEEFAHYIDGSKDAHDYYSQKCETSARRYAKTAVDDYYSKINKYIANSSVETEPSVTSPKYRFVEDSGWSDTGIRRFIGDNGLLGYLDSHGKEIVSPVFVYASSMRYGIAMVSEGPNRIYYIDSNGNRLTDDYSDGYEFNYDLGIARVRTKDGKWSLIDRQGKTLLGGADEIEEFPLSDIGTAVIEGHAVLLRLTTEGEIKCDVICRFDDYTDISYMSGGLFAIVSNVSGKQGVVSYEGETIIPAEFESIDYEYVYGNGNSRYVLILFKLIKDDGSVEYRGYEP